MDGALDRDLAAPLVIRAGVVHGLASGVDDDGWGLRHAGWGMVDARPCGWVEASWRVGLGGPASESVVSVWMVGLTS
jgi:hypothetical protein